MDKSQVHKNLLDTATATKSNNTNDLTDSNLAGIQIDRANRSKFLSHKKRYLDAITELAETICTFSNVDPINYALTEDFAFLVPIQKIAKEKSDG